MTIFILLYILFKIFQSLGLETFIEAVGAELQTDSYGHVNFLILGHGGENHDGGNLMDTIIIASLDTNSKKVTMLSIPRDFYITDNQVGSSKINSIFYHAQQHFDSEEKGLNYMIENTIEDLVGMPIHYWVKVDFKGFTEFIDAIGGIEVDVKKSISDPFYPKDGTYDYEPFYISAGRQTLDGATALKYARSRKTTSDFDRADRQQQIIYAVKQKATQSNIITDLDKITDIYRSVNNNVKTNLSLREMLTLGGVAKDLTSQDLNQRLIHDDPTRCGGLLYVPEKSFFNGAYVQLAAGGEEFIHKYSELNFNHPQAISENSEIVILNGTRTTGVASEIYRILNRFCLEIPEVGNARSKEITQTTYFYKLDLEGNKPAILNFLTTFIPGKLSTNIPPEYNNYFLEHDIILEIGSDYTQSANYINDPFNALGY